MARMLCHRSGGIPVSVEGESPPASHPASAPELWWRTGEPFHLGSRSRAAWEQPKVCWHNVQTLCYYVWWVIQTTTQSFEDCLHSFLTVQAKGFTSSHQLSPLPHAILIIHQWPPHPKTSKKLSNNLVTYHFQTSLTSDVLSSWCADHLVAT